MGLSARRAFIKGLADHEPKPTPELVEACDNILTPALLAIQVASDPIAARFMIVNEGSVYTSQVETMAVMAAAGTGVVLAINPECVVRRLSGPNHEGNVAFGLVHEVYHLMNKHLHVGQSGPAWELATEIRVNHDTMDVLRCGMPQVYLDPDDPSKGTEEFGINPRKMWEKCRDDLRKQGKTPPSYDEFVETDLGCQFWLSQMTKLPNPPRRKGGSKGKGGWPCDHHGTGQQPLPLDQEEVDTLSEEVIDAIYKKATVEQDPRARDALIRMHKGSNGSDKASKMWGELGIGALYGEPLVRRTVRFWQQWLKQQLGSRLVPGRRLTYDRRKTVIDQQLKRDPILAFRGQERETTLLVFADTSGSMCEDQLEWLRQHIGEEKGLTVEYFCVDTELYPMSWGEPFKGRGGTDFRCIDTYLRTRRRRPDAVVIVSDCYVDESSKIVPGGDPRKVVWLITHDGDDWPKSHAQPMSTYRLPAPS